MAQQANDNNTHGKNGRPRLADRNLVPPDPTGLIFRSFCQYDTGLGIKHGFDTNEKEYINCKKKSVIFSLDEQFPIDQAKKTIDQQIEEMLDDRNSVMSILNKDIISKIILKFVRLYPKECIRQISHTMVLAIASLRDSEDGEQRLNKQFDKLRYFSKKIFAKVKLRGKRKRLETEEIKYNYKILVKILRQEFERFANTPNQIREFFQLCQEQKQWAEDMERQLSEQIERERERRRSAAETDQLPQAQ